MVMAIVAAAILVAGCTPQPADENKARASTPKAPTKATAQPSDAADVSAVAINLAGGEKKKISDYAGKVVVLDFWATYCKPCIEKLPKLEAAEKKWGPGVVVIAVTTDPDLGTATGWAKAHKMGLPIAEYTDEMQKVFFKGEETVAIPQTRVIDQSGKLAKSWGPDGTHEELEQEVQALLAGAGKSKG
jgi:thiol-disulfide isomerase/thioredoxin